MTEESAYDLTMALIAVLTLFFTGLAVGIFAGAVYVGFQWAI
jgi:hypothetical protein